jgi:uncharacterized protein
MGITVEVAFDLLAWACAAVDSLAAGVVFWRHAGLPLPSVASQDRMPGTSSTRILAALLRAVAIAGVLWGIKAAAFKLVGVNWFGLVRLAYYDIILVPLVLGLAGIVLRRRKRVGAIDAVNGAAVDTPRRRSIKRIAATALVMTVSIAPASVCAYASRFAPYQLVIERPNLELHLPAAARTPIRIGIIADLQIERVTDFERGAVARLMSESPDLLLLPGDYLQLMGPTWRQDWMNHPLWPEFRHLAQSLAAPGGAFAALGDVDEPRRTERLFDGSHVRLLVNAVQTTTVKGVRFAIGGIELNYTSPRARRAIDQLRDTPADVRVLVAHRPDIARLLTPTDHVDLVVCGHTHGGQIVIPGLGPLITLTRVPRHIAAGGLYQLDRQWTYVSRGLGMERGLAPPVRLFCPPEVAVLSITSE